jgi:hypothetical protein
VPSRTVEAARAREEYEISGGYFLHDDMDDLVGGADKLGLELQIPGAIGGLLVSVAVLPLKHTRVGTLGR